MTRPTMTEAIRWATLATLCEDTIDTADRCSECGRHYGDSGPCDEGKPVASPHRSAVPPQAVARRIVVDGS